MDLPDGQIALLRCLEGVAAVRPDEGALCRHDRRARGPGEAREPLAATVRLCHVLALRCRKRPLRRVAREGDGGNLRVGVISWSSFTWVEPIRSRVAERLVKRRGALQAQGCAAGRRCLVGVLRSNDECCIALLCEPLAHGSYLVLLGVWGLSVPSPAQVVVVLLCGIRIGCRDDTVPRDS